MQFPKAKVLNEIDLNTLVTFILDEEYKCYFLAEAGKEHHRLLSFMSKNISGDIVEIGAYKGTSALALSFNDMNQVYSFDIKHITALSGIRNNIKFITDNDCINNYKSIVLGAKLVFLDVNHDGLYENKVYQFLIDNNYKGLLLLDDIYLNKAMKAFWNSIKKEKKDLTDIGHWSGTGLVIFE